MRSKLFVVLLVPALLPSPDLSQNVPSAPASDLRLTVQTTGNQSIFRIGEIIPLQLAFTSTSRERYTLDLASYDRSGRLNEEKFAIEPSKGWDDPLEIYFHSYQGFIGGGLRGSKLLSNEPSIIRLNLNEWIRFKTPGRYRLIVTSARVSRTRPPFANGELNVTSNDLTFDIVPATKEWQESALREAISVLDSSKQARAGQSDSDDARVRAVKTLRYLGTAHATREMAHRLVGADSDWDFMAGLVGSPAREAALEEMKKLLGDPDFPVTGRFLSTMSVLAVAEDAGENLPARRETAEKQFRQDLIAAIPGKKGAALAISSNTIVEDAAVHSGELPTDLKRMVTAELIANFDKLPIEKQADLIQYRWAALDHQEMLPLLRNLAQRYRDFSELREMNAFQFNNTTAAALKYWYEIAPDEARPAVIREILRPKPRFGASALGILPDKELPEADQALANHLNSPPSFETRANVASLIQRYASPAIEPQVLSFLDPALGKLECAVQEPLLAYVLRVDAEAARPLLETAMAARGEGFSACNHALLPEVARAQNAPILQDIAIKSLEDADPQIVESAASYLMEYGSASAEDALWDRFTTWSEHWKGREGELQYVPGQKLDGAYEAGAGSKLMEAIARGQSWLVDENKLHRLMDLSVGPQQRQQAEQFLRIWQTRPWSIQFIPFEKGQFQIVQYQLRSLQAAKDKLAQFPRGSAFQWSGPGTQDDEEQAFREISDFAVGQGEKVVKTHE